MLNINKEVDSHMFQQCTTFGYILEISINDFFSINWVFQSWVNQPKSYTTSGSSTSLVIRSNNKK